VWDRPSNVIVPVAWAYLPAPPDDRQIHVRDELAGLAGHGRAHGKARGDQHVARRRQKDFL
jgi:hypothetical protein